MKASYCASTAPLILVVDDNEAKRYTIARTLKRVGYDIVEAATGTQALELALDKQPVMIILDIKLPDINGFEVCRIIKSNPQYSSIAILHISATYNTSQDRVYGLDEGADAFLDQGAEPEELIATVKALLRMRNAEIALRKQNERLRIISAASEQLLADKNPDAMAQDLFTKIAGLLGIDTYICYTTKEGLNALVLESCAGIPEAWIPDVSRVQYGHGICGTVARDRKPITVTDIQRVHDSRANIARDIGLRVYACNPLLAGNRLLGTLAFASRNRDSFDEDELEFLNTVSHYVALAKEKQRTLKEVQATAQALKQANMRKDEFLANMSHEIRTPMNAVVGLTDILSMSRPLTDKQQEFVKTLKLSANSLLELINDLLDIAKIESQHIQLEKTPFRLKELVDEIININSVKANDKNIPLHLRFDPALAHEFIGDPTRIRQILMNLISNAVKFTDQGSVTVEVIKAGESLQGDNIHISVKDTGIGIPQDKMEIIFSKFSQADTSTTRKYGGTGLGLAITKTLIEIMEGEIFLTSKEGEGSIFKISFYLPVSNQNVSADIKKPESKQTKQSSMQKKNKLVLLVEDYAANVLVATTLLDFLGYRYEIAQNGEEAISKTRQQAYDLILMDVQMPGIDGFTATRIIREEEKKNRTRRTPIIGITAFALSGDKEKCMQSGMDDYVSKPFDPKKLEEKIASFITPRAMA